MHRTPYDVEYPPLAQHVGDSERADAAFCASIEQGTCAEVHQPRGCSGCGWTSSSQGPHRQHCTGYLVKLDAPFVTCGLRALWRIDVLKDPWQTPHHSEGACSRAHLARLLSSLAIHGLCEFNVRAITPEAFGPEGAGPPHPRSVERAGDATG